ncbi:MAG: hypothetical protein E7324_01820 [Clostridiales bacterium]|nr:hypothetical protein [Clostridiales bacterium]
MKKILSGILVALMVMAMIPAMAEEATLPTYQFGGAASEFKTKLWDMGEKSFYPMYSTAYNSGADFDITTLKLCAQNDAFQWKPAEVSPKDGIDFKGDWFSIRDDGFVAADEAFVAALKWVCEVDGVYDIQLNLSGGTSGGAADTADGVYMSAYIQGEQIFCYDTYTFDGHRLPQTENFFGGVELKAGDEIILVSDSKLNGGWDDPWWYLHVGPVVEEEEVVEEVAEEEAPVILAGYQYGGGATEYKTKLWDAGEKGFYPVYSTAYNSGADLDLSTLKDCVLTEAFQWKPAESSFVGENECKGDWFGIRDDGLCAPDVGFVAGLKWVCPADGLYIIKIGYAGGTSDPSQAAADGVYMSAYIKGEQIFCVDTYEERGHRVTGTVYHDFENYELKAGDEIIIAADSKLSGGWDDPWFGVYIYQIAE